MFEARAQPAPLLMLQGTASSVGKSVLTAAFCRILLQDGYRVAPFKAQNMSNNADVTPDGLEIGRAQPQQAAAAGLAPRVEMNPVLIKPQGDRTAQLVIDGRPAGTLKAEDYLNRRPRIWPSVERSLATLRAEFDVVVAEGAGSPAEPNLRQADVVNMELALHASDTGGVNRSASVLIVGDIDRGSVFAHLVGTMQLLAPNERALVRGFLINRFRGDPSLLDPALIDLEQRTGVPVLGVIPWIDDLGLAEEDGVALERPLSVPAPAASTDADPDLDLVVCRLPRIANFDDFDPLTREPGVRLRYIDDPAQLGKPAQAARPDCLIIPGTKATIADLQFLQRSGQADAIQSYAADGGTVLGICGGYQMLGRTLIDQSGVEGAIGARADGRYLLPVAMQFHEMKRTQQVSGRLVAAAGPWSTATKRGRKRSQPSPWLAAMSASTNPEWTMRKTVASPSARSVISTVLVPGGKGWPSPSQPQLQIRREGGSRTTYSPRATLLPLMSTRKRPPGRGSRSALRPIHCR